MLKQISGVYFERKLSNNQTQHQIILIILKTKQKINERHLFASMAIFLSQRYIPMHLLCLHQFKLTFW